jgi:hypothetical protein
MIFMTSVTLKQRSKIYGPRKVLYTRISGRKKERHINFIPASVFEQRIWNIRYQFELMIVKNSTLLHKVHIFIFISHVQITAGDLFSFYI